MRAIVVSIHSQVYRAISELHDKPELVVSLDSHLDVALGEDDSVYPEELRMIARRTGAHTMIRRLLDGHPEKGNLVVAIPERMLSKHAEDVESSLPDSLRVGSLEESVLSVVEFLKKERGIEVFESPPKSLLQLVSRTRSSPSWILDIDVDYMQEMQEECYTRILRPGRGVLQTSQSVLQFIEKSAPETIILSEAKVKVIRNTQSRFSRFVEALKVLGYAIEENEVAESDLAISKGISDCRAFYRSVSKVLLAEHMGEMMKGDLSGFLRDEQAASRKFFAGRGYGQTRRRMEERRVGRE